MTEADWQACEDPRRMAGVAFTGPRATARTLRLFVAAFWGWQAGRLLTEDSRTDLLRRVAQMSEWAESGRLKRPARASRSANVIFFNQDARRAAIFTVTSQAVLKRSDADGRLVQALLIHCLFGNPFRPVVADPAWLTPTVVGLARQMYESRDFSPLPILADALQDAGCEDADVLAHGRGPGPHVRGCWVVDLVLGKG